MSWGLFPKSLQKALEDQKEIGVAGRFVHRKWYWIGKEMQLRVEKGGWTDREGKVDRETRASPMPGWISGDSSEHSVHPARHMLLLLRWTWVRVQNILAVIVAATADNLKKIFYWAVVNLQCHVSLRCTEKQISYTYTYIHSFLDSFPI